MDLKLQQISQITLGAVEIKQQTDGIHFYRFTEQQQELYKRLKEEYDDYSDKISDQEDKLADLEDRYYDQFAAMEKAMSNLNSQQSYISNLFG